MGGDKKIYEELSDFIPLIRRQMGLSQRDLALKSNVPQSTITRLEKHGDQTTLKTLTKVLESVGYRVFVAPKEYRDHEGYLKLQKEYDKISYKFEEIRKLINTP